MRRRAKGQGGFSLIELLLVTIIIGILTAIAVPMFLVQRQRARNTAVKAGIHHIQVGVQAAAADNDDKYPSPMAVQPTGSVAKYVSPWPKNPWTGAKMARYPNDGSMPGMASELGWTGAAKSHKGNYMYWFAGSPDPEEAYKLRGGGTVSVGSGVSWIITVP